VERMLTRMHDACWIIKLDSDGIDNDTGGLLKQWKVQ
jgi:hypothetical protein